MRMAALKLVADAVEHVIDGEMTGFGRHLGVKHDLKLEVTELIRERIHVVTGDCVRDFISFLDRVGRDRAEILRTIPFAAVHGVAQAPHDGRQSLEGHFASFRGLSRSKIKV